MPIFTRRLKLATDVYTRYKPPVLYIPESFDFAELLCWSMAFYISGIYRIYLLRSNGTFI